MGVSVSLFLLVESIKMHLSLNVFVSVLVSSAVARPTAKSQGFGVSSIELHEDLQQLWYTEYTKDEETPVSVKTSVKLLSSEDPAAVYSCAGPKAADFPDQDEWLTFDQLWDINEPVLSTANGGDTYNDDIKGAIQDVALSSKVDARLILAIIMQEVYSLYPFSVALLTSASRAETYRFTAPRRPPAA